jgi:signal transduction histidine kinase
MQLEKFRVPDDVKLDLEFSADIPILSLYSFDIVVQNLIQNALDAMPNGGHLTISTRSVLDADAGYVELSVEDTGMGISADVLPRIFELNFSTKHSRGRAHGLGLWWIRNFVLRSRGDITVTSTPNGGSEFIVKIPVDHRARDAAVLPAAG